MKTSRITAMTTTTATTVLLASLLVAASSYAQADHPRPMRGDPEQMTQRHLDHMAKAVDATPEQKAKLTAIAKAAQADIKPLDDQLKASHLRGQALYTAPAIDRAAIEQHRAEQFKIMEHISRRRSQARLDSAEVLSAEQRAKLAAQMKAHPERRGWGGMPPPHPSK